MPKYSVTLCRYYCHWEDWRVEAVGEREARGKAMLGEGQEVQNSVMEPVSLSVLGEVGKIREVP